MTDTRFDPPSAADPRLSEWLDGRLSTAEAAEMARCVAASPELARVVDDLRRQKELLAGLPTSAAPAGFVQDVLAALDGPADDAADDAEVEAEWRRIERERLEEEIAEAREDAAEPVSHPMRQRWPWLALAGALAAGLLVAIVVNGVVAPGDRRVALGDRTSEAEKNGASGAGFTGQPEQPASDQESGRVAANRDENLVWAPNKPALQAEQQQVARMDGAPPPGVPAPRRRESQEMEARDSKVLPAPAAKEEKQPRAVQFRIRTAADRQWLDTLLAAGSLGQADQPRSEPPANADAAEAAEKKAIWGAVQIRRAAPGETAAGSGNAGPGREKIVITGPAAALTRLAASLEAGPPDRKRAASDARAAAAQQGQQADKAQAQGEGHEAAKAGKGGGAGQPTASTAVSPEADMTLVIEVVEESAAGEQP